ncbi:MAG TPA: hypothetical protein VG308_04155 [Stellaceae bacterium]|jgi:hypothetical protein|nr:hypothetical protein [Stellaceae bacterium]
MRTPGAARKQIRAAATHFGKRKDGTIIPAPAFLILAQRNINPIALSTNVRGISV